jgi:asparagine synthase (glutamine-hydrolysing)
MSGLCGWIEGDGVGDAAAILAQMAGSLPAFGRCRDETLIDDGAGLGSRGDPRTSSVASKDGVLAAIEGTPRWTRADLIATAKAEGFAAALVAAWQQLGPGLSDYLHGAFAFAIVDGKRRKAVCAIDRAGTHTMCWARSDGGGLVFGSTTDAVRAHPGITAAIDPLAIYMYLYYVDRIPAPATVYRGMQKLQPGEMVVFDAARIDVRRYWQISYVAASEPADVLAGALRDTLRQAVVRSAAPVEAVGAFLSGGLDSSTVAGLLSEWMPHPKAFTIAFEDHRFDESGYARISAERFGLDHHIFTVRPEHVLRAIEPAVRIYDEPFGNSSVVPTYYCALAAREAGVEIMLAGDGGDELFAGNERYLKDRIFQRYSRVPAMLRKLAIEPLCLRLSPDSTLALVRKAAKYVRLARLPLAVRATMGNVFGQWGVDEVLSSDLMADIDMDGPRGHAMRIFDEMPQASDLQRFLYFDHRVTLADSDLRKVNRMCELAGVSVRYPMLDDDVIALSARIPSELLCAGGRLRGFYKDAFRDFLPPQILAKQKHGFGLPYLQFLSTDASLRELSCESLRRLTGYGYFRPEFLDRLINQLRNRQDVDGTVWDLVVLSLWLDSRRSPDRADTKKRVLVG